MGSWVSSKKLKCVLFAYEEIKKVKIFKGQTEKAAFLMEAEMELKER